MSAGTIIAIVIAVGIVAFVWVTAWKLRTPQGPVSPGSGTADPRPGSKPKPPTE